MEQDVRLAFLQDLAVLFDKAVASEQLALALRIKEVMGKAMGFLGPQTARSVLKPLVQWSDQEVRSVLAQLEARLEGMSGASAGERESAGEGIGQQE